MDLYEVLSNASFRDNAFICITGGGGKTTLMECFASHLRSKGKKVLLTTTTRIRSPYLHDYHADVVFGDDSVLSFFPSGPCVVAYALENRETGKWSCPPLGNLDVLRQRYDVVLCEADGSRGLPLKIHTRRDPVVPPFCTYTVSVMGLQGIGQRACDVCFGDGRDVIVDTPYLRSYIADPEGLLKGSIPGSRAIVFSGTDCLPDDSAIPGIPESPDYPADVLVLAADLRTGKHVRRILN